MDSLAVAVRPFWHGRSPGSALSAYAASRSTQRQALVQCDRRVLVGADDQVDRTQAAALGWSGGGRY
jgi:hypothetical protein